MLLLLRIVISDTQTSNTVGPQSFFKSVEGMLKMFFCIIAVEGFKIQDSIYQVAEIGNT